MSLKHKLGLLLTHISHGSKQILNQFDIILSLVALGTSLPELSTALVAAFHKSSDVAIGNVVGSNLFNILAIIGVTAILTDIPVASEFMQFDIWVMLGASVTLWIAALIKGSLGRLMGVFYLASYVLYIWFLF